MNYAEYMFSKAPPWLQDQYGGAWMTGLGGTIDDYVADFSSAVTAAFPGMSPSDALGIIGDEIGIDRGPTESDADYALRLFGAWTAWVYAGSPLGVLVALFWAGCPGAILIQQNGIVWSLSGSPVAGEDPASLLANGDTSVLAATLTSTVDKSRTIPADTKWATLHLHDTDFTSRFVVAFHHPTTVSTVDAARITAAVTKWKPAKSTCVAVVAYGNAHGAWGWPVRKWGDGTKWGATDVTQITGRI